MSLTVPSAGVIAGRAAQPVANPAAGEIGAAFSELGARVADTFGRIEAERLDREMSRINTGITRDLGQLRLQVEDMGDPDAMGHAWDQGVAHIRQQYLTGQDANGRPLVDPANRANFGIAFDDLTTTHGLALGGQMNGLKRSQRAATYYEYTNVAGQQAATADPTTRAKLYSDFDVETQKQVDAGTMTPEQAAVAKREFRESTEGTNAIDMLSADPTRLIQMIDGGELPNLDPETAATWRARAQDAVDQQTKEGLRQSKAAAEDKIKDQIGIYAAGRVPTDPAWIDTPDAKASPKYGELVAARDLAKERGDLRSKTVGQLDAIIAEEEKKPIDAPYQNDRLAFLRNQRAAAADGWRSDPVKFASGQTSQQVPTLPALDPTNPGAYAKGIAARVTFGQGLKEDGFTTDAPILSNVEQDDLKKALAAITDPEQRATVAASIIGAVTARKGNPAGIAAFQAAPLLSWTGNMLAAGSMTPSVAGEILRGQEAIDQKTVILPPAKDRMAPTFGQVENLFRDVPGGAAIEAQAVAAADAIYAARQGRVDPAGDIDEGLYQQSLHEAMGGTGQFGTDTARGGVQEVNGKLTILDPGIRAADVETVSDAIIADLQAPLARTRATRPDPGRARKAILGAAGGKEPTINGEPLTADDWRGATFVATGRDRYALILNIGEGRQATTADGAPFTFSMKSLLAGYGK